MIASVEIFMMPVSTCDEKLSFGGLGFVGKLRPFSDSEGPEGWALGASTPGRLFCTPGWKAGVEDEVI
jgi:hypothetical protein